MANRSHVPCPIPGSGRRQDFTTSQKVLSSVRTGGDRVGRQQSNVGLPNMIKPCHRKRRTSTDRGRRVTKPPQMHSLPDLAEIREANASAARMGQCNTPRRALAGVSVPRLRLLRDENLLAPELVDVPADSHGIPRHNGDLQPRDISMRSTLLYPSSGGTVRAS